MFIQYTLPQLYGYNIYECTKFVVFVLRFNQMYNSVPSNLQEHIGFILKTSLVNSFACTVSFGSQSILFVFFVTNITLYQILSTIEKLL